MKDVDPVIHEWNAFLKMYTFAIEEVNTKLTILRKGYHHGHEHTPIEYLKSRVKDPTSIAAKLERKGYEKTTANAQAYIRDIAGIRLICPFVSDIYMLYEWLKKQPYFQIIEAKDYVNEPKVNGYQSFHIIMRIPVFLNDRTVSVFVEIQIRTIAMDFWATLEHKMYYRHNKEGITYLANELKGAADIVQYLDHKMEAMNNHIGQTDLKVIPFDRPYIRKQKHRLNVKLGGGRG